MFNSEQELVNTFQSHRNNPSKILQIIGCRRRAFHVFNEYNSSHGIADLVVVSAKKARNEPILKRPAIALDWVYLLSTLSMESEYTIQEMQEWLGVSRRTVAIKMTEYLKAGFLTQTAARTYRKVKEYRPIVKDIVAIEAKLSNWRKALSQALRYRFFSHFSFVLLDAARAKAAVANMDIFEEYDIGLVTYDHDTKWLFVHYCPKSRNTPAAQNVYRVNEALYSNCQLQ